MHFELKNRCRKNNALFIRIQKKHHSFICLILGLENWKDTTHTT